MRRLQNMVPSPKSRLSGGIKRRITAVSLVLSLVPIIVFSGASYFYFDGVIQRTSADRFQMLASTKAEHVEEFYINNKDSLASMSRNPTLKQALLEFTESYERHGHLSDQFRSTELKYGDYLLSLQYLHNFDDLLLISKRGDVVFSLLKESDFASNLKNGPYSTSQLAVAFQDSQFLLATQISRFRFYEPSASSAAFVVAPVYSEKQSHITSFQGAIAGQLSLNMITSLASDYRGLGDSGEIVVVSEKDGLPELVAPLRHSTSELFRVSFEIDTEQGAPALYALKGLSGFGVEKDYRDVESVASWSYLPHSRLGMVVKMDRSEIYEETIGLRLWLIAGSLLISVGIIYLAGKFSNTLAEPIVLLAEASKLFSQDKVVILPVETTDEIGLLNAAFNDMQRTVKAAKQSQQNMNEFLERRVADRTSELSQANEELSEAMSRLSESQEGYVQAEKMASLGVMTAGVGHEINNPLMGVINYVEYAENHSDDVKVKETLHKAGDALGRIKDIVMNMMTYSHKSSGEIESIAVTQVVEKVVELLTIDFEGRGIDIASEIEQPMPNVTISTTELFQCILNLMLNARDAIAEQSEKKIKIALYSKNEFVFVDISDTGPGISAESREKIFDPFFTTKAVGKGTGLGLSVSKNMIETNGGSLTEEGDDKGGALFRIRLPVS